MAIHKNCDGTTRRDVLKVGALGGLGLSLGSFLKLQAANEVRPNAAQSAIFINLAGGPSHLDTFDLKPEGPENIRGEFKPIPTNVAGLQISEYLPKLAQCADLFTVLRGVSHTLAAHELGSEYVNTGNRPLPSLEFPGYGAVVTKEKPGPADLPPYVAVPNTIQKGGYLGVQYAPLTTGAVPQPGKPFGVRGISLRNGLTVADVEKRELLLKDLDKTFRDVETGSQLLDGLDRFSQQAYTIITSQRARDAFDVSQESPAYAQTFGKTPFGQSCLLASRLISSGVRFVTITLGGWDTHADNFGKLKSKQLPPLDEGLSALFQGLRTKGLLDSTAVFVTGEFGRTPKINDKGGRDHCPRAMFMLMAGGAIRGGRVIGASDDKGSEPVGTKYSPDDVAASFYHNLGIDSTHEYETNTGRPVMIVRNGKVIKELFA